MSFGHHLFGSPYSLLCVPVFFLFGGYVNTRGFRDISVQTLLALGREYVLCPPFVLFFQGKAQDKPLETGMGWGSGPE